tara:strand:- start:241 stop:459 length:219 start_codon:yes stop_codon:yes gene_type:complete
MQNDYLNNKKRYTLDKLQKSYPTINQSSIKSVDINKLLNRVKIEKLKKKKENLVLSIILLCIFSITLFISLV